MTNPTNILRRTAARRENAFWGPVCVGCIHGACRFFYLLNGTLDRTAPDAQIGVTPDIFGLVHSVTSAFWRLPAGSGGMSPVIKYRLVVGGVGIVYDGESEREAKRQFNLFVIQSKDLRSKSARRSVTLFKNYEIIKEYNPPES
jgi:hypothetical protein